MRSAVCGQAGSHGRPLLQNRQSLTLKLFFQELVDAARRTLLAGSTATLKTLSEKLGETTEVPQAEASLNEAMQRWNSSVSRVVGETTRETSFLWATLFSGPQID